MTQGSTCSDLAFMRRAIDAARRAGARGEVPVGAVLTDARGDLLAVTGNGTLELTDPTAHAEILALREASRKAGVPRLPGGTLYVTLEPCLMCLGAMIHARISRLVFAAPDPKIGATGLLAQIPVGFQGLNHRLSVDSGILAEEAANLLRAFFRERRN